MAGKAARAQSVSPRPAAPAERQITRLDRLIHDRVRLGILSALAASATLSFAELKSTLDLTDGNLSVHARKLEEAGYVQCRKSFSGRTRTPHPLFCAGVSAASCIAIASSSA